MIGIVVLSFVASAVATGVYVNSACPHVTPMDNFNMDAFGSGKWYENQRYENKVENKGTCGFAEYVRNGDVFSIKNYDVLNRRMRFIAGSGQMAYDAGRSGKMIFTYPYGAYGSNTQSTVWVLGTDYDNYAVLYFCKEKEDKTIHQDFVWVLSRSKKLDAVSKAAVDKIIQDNSFIDSSKLLKTDFSDAACQVDAY